MDRSQFDPRLDEIVRRSLVSFAAEALNGSWSGRREREAVSLYVFGHLLREVSPDGFLIAPTQIGIEFPVPQLPAQIAQGISKRNGSKEQVCKDLVIWPEPRMTCWDQHGQPAVAPAAIIEWKFCERNVRESDIAWLSAFSKVYPPFVGYAVTGNLPGAKFRLSCTRVKDGLIEREWLHVI